MLFRAYSYIIESDFDLYLPEVHGIPDFYISSASLSVSQLTYANVYRKGVQAQVGYDHLLPVLHWENIATFQVLSPNHLGYKRLGEDDDVFRLFVLSEALGLLLLQKGLFLLHGSAVKVKDQAMVFLGRPGAGKSTTLAAFAQHNHPILSDDLTAIGFNATGQPCVLPGFPQVKIWENSVDNLGFDKKSLQPAFEGHNKFLYQQPLSLFPTEPVLLKKVIILQRPYSSKTGAVKFTESPLEFTQHFPLPSYLLRGDWLKKHFQNSLSIASKVAIEKVARPKTFKALQKWIHDLTH